MDQNVTLCQPWSEKSDKNYDWEPARKVDVDDDDAKEEPTKKENDVDEEVDYDDDAKEEPAKKENDVDDAGEEPAKKVSDVDEDVDYVDDAKGGTCQEGEWCWWYKRGTCQEGAVNSALFSLSFTCSGCSPSRSPIF